MVAAERLPGASEYVAWETQPPPPPPPVRTLDSHPPTPGALSELLTAPDGSTYLLFLPRAWEAGQRQRHPTLLFLHGRGGVKNEANVRGQSLTRRLAEPAFGRSCPFIVLTPICPKASGWVPQLGSLLELLALSRERLGADPARTYLTGQSMGGHGCWHLAAAHPGLFAAVAPVCGYTVEPSREELPPAEAARAAAPPPALLAALRSTPVWAFHSADDTVVPVVHTDAVVSALRAAGNADVRLTRYKTAPPCKTKARDLPGHGSYELAYATVELWEWLLSHQRPPG